MTRAKQPRRYLEILDWDTTFFRTRIARVVREPRSPRAFAAVFREARRAAIECLYLEAPAGGRAAALAGAHGLELVDVRILLDHEFDRSTPPEALPTIDIGPARPGDVPQLERIAERCCHVSRYHADPRFRRHAPRLYRRWITEACRGWADAVLVARRDAEPVGFITCKREPTAAACGKIDLVCVDPANAGRGIGSVMAAAALEWFERHGLRRVGVVTQGHNIGALRLYERLGFRVARVSLFYHGWLPGRRRA